VSSFFEIFFSSPLPPFLSGVIWKWVVFLYDYRDNSNLRRNARFYESQYNTDHVDSLYYSVSRLHSIQGLGQPFQIAPTSIWGNAII